MTAMMKAIPTEYNGTIFRSRLEARWAMLFDRHDILYVYEPNGYEINGCSYIPDFFLPVLNTFIEVKGDVENRRSKEKVFNMINAVSAIDESVNFYIADSGGRLFCPGAYFDGLTDEDYEYSVITLGHCMANDKVFILDPPITSICPFCKQPFGKYIVHKIIDIDLPQFQWTGK